MLKGHLSKMQVAHENPIEYQLVLDEQTYRLNDVIGKKIKIEYVNEIHCTNCSRKTNKSYNQGYCFVCSQQLARCDMCILKPELCHYDKGTCREPQWGETHCLRPHIVYLANTSGIKVGITRETQMPIRWIDQGATQALQIAKVKDRLTSGLIEHWLKDHFNDKTNWRNMLKGQVELVDLEQVRDDLFKELSNKPLPVDEEAIEWLKVNALNFNYPVETFPTKITSYNLDKNPIVEGILEGIKGQYLILDGGVINIRKYTGYLVEFSV